MLKTNFILYIAGDNNLDSFGSKDIEEILSVKDEKDNLTIYVQYDYSSLASSKRFIIKNGHIVDSYEIGETNTGEVQTLSSFLEWGVQTDESNRNIVILWNHGGGTLDREISSYYPLANFENEAIAFDDNSKDYLDNIELKKAFKTFDKKIDIIGFDACLMGMLEVVFQLRNQAKIIVGSEYLEPAEGWDYATLLQYIIDNPNASNEDISKEMVRGYISFYKDKKRFVSLSAIDTQRLNGVVYLMNDLADSLLTYPHKISLFHTLHPIYKMTQTFSEDYLDLYHFVLLLKESCLNHDITKKSDNFLKEFNKLIVANETDSLENSYGLSIYLPFSKEISDFSLNIFLQLDINQRDTAPSWLKLFKEIQASSKTIIERSSMAKVNQKNRTLEERKEEQWELSEQRYHDAEKEIKDELTAIESKGLEAVVNDDKLALRKSLVERNDYFALERILGKKDLLSINYLMLGIKASRSVARVHIRTERGFPAGYGTGFLISPSLFLTNHHILPNVYYAQHSQIEFDFEMDEMYQLKQSHYFQLATEKFFYTSKELDFTIVAVNLFSVNSSSLSEFGHLVLTEASGKSLQTESVSIIQHPEGSDKHITIRNNKVLGRFKEYIHYEADTMSGSSGSPVFNDQWDVVALHHSGVPKKDSNGNVLRKDGKLWERGHSDEDVDWIANEGIRISSIFQHLKEQRDWKMDEARVLEELGRVSHSDLNEYIIHFAGASNIITGEFGSKQPTLPSTSPIKLSELVNRLEDKDTTEQSLTPYFVLSQESQRGIDPLFKVNNELVITDAPELEESALLLNSANWICRRTRHKQYQDKLKNGAKVKIISEGDSWFQYPYILNDVIDHLMQVEDFAILSFGEAGDLMRDMVAKSEFVSSLSSEQPDFFLISGGGNDLVAGGGITNYIKKPETSFDPKYLINRIEFSKFKMRLASDYTNLFSIILQTKPDIQIICHGYSYPVPNGGKWFGQPLNELGIKDEQLQAELIRLLFDEINQLLQQTAESFPTSVHFLDLRNVVPERGWYDELHPTNPFFGDIASVFQDKIESLLGDKDKST